MNQAGTVAVLALAAIVLRTLFAHVVIWPGVVVPVAGLVFMALAVTAIGFVWLMTHDVRRARRYARMWHAW